MASEKRWSRVGAELRYARLVGGGDGTIIVASFVTGRAEWVGDEGCAAMMRAAAWMGFGNGCTWQEVVDAIAAGCLNDVLSYAIEEVESDG